MSVSNGQLANATTFNNAFASKSADNTFAGIQDLANAAAASGTTVVNAQREHNGVASFTGRTLNGAKDQLPTWSDNSVGVSTDNLKARADALTTYAKSLFDNKVTGPASATDNAVVRYDATAGKLVQDSLVIIGDTGNVTGVVDLTTTGNAIIGGNLQVDGTLTTINTTTLEIEDPNIILNNGGNQATADDVAGITVEMSDADDGVIIYDKDVASKWKIGTDVTKHEALTTNHAQVVTLKDIDGGTATNTSRITVPKETTANLTALTRKQGTILYDTTLNKFKGDDGAALFEIGSGSGGSGGINYLDANPGAETDTTGWVTYDDASETPVDGLGGTVTTTWTRSTTVPLRETGHFILTKDAANRLGEGVAYAFSINNADLAKVLQISFDYKIVSGTYVDNDISIWIIKDPAGTPVAIQPAPYLLKNHTTNGERWFGEFQTDATETDYSILVHIKSTSALAYVVAFDNFIVGPQAKLYGSPVTDWVAYTPTITFGSGSMTNQTVTGFYRKVGDSLEMTGNIAFSGAAGTWSSPKFSLPAGLSIDTAKLSTIEANLGSGHAYDTGSTIHVLNMSYASSTTVQLYVGDASSTYTRSAALSQAVPFAFASGDNFNWYAKAPILGFSSSAIMSNDADTRIVFALVEGDPASATVGNPIIFPSKTYDTHGAYNISTGKYLAQLPGYYRFSGYISSSNTGIQLTVEVDDVGIVNVGATDSNGECAFTGIVLARAGQNLHLSPSGTLDCNSASHLSIEKLSGPSQIMANESNNIRASNTAGTSIANTGDVVVPFATETWDTHGQWITDTFTAQQSGKYEVKAQVWFASATYAAGNRVHIGIQKNGSTYSFGERNIVFAIFTDIFTCEVLDDVQLLAGETIKIFVSNNRTAGATNLDTTAGANYVNIKRTGNY